MSIVSTETLVSKVLRTETRRCVSQVNFHGITNISLQHRMRGDSQECGESGYLEKVNQCLSISIAIVSQVDSRNHNIRLQQRPKYIQLAIK